MADNILVTPGVGATIAADEIGGALHQRVKIVIGADGVNDGDVSSTNPIPVVQTGTPSLPTGAATEAKQDTGNSSLSSIDTKLTSQATASNQTAGNSSLSSIDTKLTSQATAANQTTANSSLSSIDSKLTSPLTVNIGTISGIATEVTLAALNTKVTAVDTGNVTVVSSALPTGAATGAKQDTGNTSLGSIDTKLTDATQKTQLVDGSGNVIGSTSNALDVNIKSGITLSVSLDHTSDNVLVYGNDGTNDQKIKTDTSGNVSVVGTFYQTTQPVSVASLPLPAGAATETTLSALNTKVTTVDTGNVTVVSSALPTGASTSALQTTANSSLSSIDTKLTSPLTVNIGTIAGIATETTLSSLNSKVTAADTGNVTISTALPTGANSIGQVTANAGTNLNTSSLALESGGNLASLNTKMPSNLTVTSTRLLVDGSGVTQPVSGTITANLGTIAGVATEVTSAAILAKLISNPATDTLQTAGNGSLSSIDSKTPALGQALAASSVPVVLTAAQITTLTPPTTVTTVDTGYSLTQFIRNDYTGVSVTTSAYTQLIASTSNAYKEIEIFDSSGQTLKLAFGGIGSEVDKMLIFPGGNGRVRLAVPASTRISVKAVSANATVGEIDLNLYG